MQILIWHLMAKKNYLAPAIQQSSRLRLPFNAIQCHFRLRRSLLTQVTSYIVTRVRAPVTV